MTHEVYNIDLNKRLTNKEIICYFNSLVNDNKLISTKRYDLEINDYSNYDDFNRIVKYSNNRYYFNQHLLITKFFAQNRNKDISNIDINLEIFEKLHEIIAEIELRRMIEDNITYKIDPLYYVYLVKEYIDEYSPKVLRKNYQKIRSLHLTSAIIKENVDNNLLDSSVEDDFNSKINSTIRNVYRKYNQSPMQQAIYNETEFLSMSDTGYYYDISSVDIQLIEKKFGKDVLNKFLDAFSRQDYSEINKSLLYKIMYGKNLTINDKKEIFNNNVIKYESILDYAERKNNFKKRIFIKNLLK